MKVTTKSAYGLLAALDLAARQADSPIQLREIAKRQGIPLKYLEQVMTPLKTSGLVRGVRGARGGYLLARPPKAISAGELLRVLEGSRVTPVLRRRLPTSGEEAGSREVWEDVERSVWALLDGITLEELAQRCRQRSKAKGGMFYI
ncbi:MAG: Rrf2 family transcriptional regulator [Nitrospirae bacterium]|nr:Rrf2 family transcriptional regulator [Nitrospirota bacterium]